MYHCTYFLIYSYFSLQLPGSSLKCVKCSFAEVLLYHCTYFLIYSYSSIQLPGLSFNALSLRFCLFYVSVRKEELHSKGLGVLFRLLQSGRGADWQHHLRLQDWRWLVCSSCTLGHYSQNDSIIYVYKIGDDWYVFLEHYSQNDIIYVCKIWDDWFVPHAHYCQFHLWNEIMVQVKMGMLFALRGGVEMFSQSDLVT